MPTAPQPPPPPKGSSQVSALTIPPETQQKYGELIELIKGSESMNDEERQYWINILPIMTPEQVENLKQILVSEKEQLAAIDKKYSKEMQGLEQVQDLKKVGEKRKERRQEITAAERKAAEEAGESAEEILKKIEGQ